MSDYPYADRFAINRVLPEKGMSREEVLAELRTMATEEDAFWETGKCSGTMYCGDHDHYHFMNEAFGLFAHVNVLQRDICPSATKFEAEIISMVLALHHGEAATATGDEPCGLVTSGGTGSIAHAVLAYREHAGQEEEKGCGKSHEPVHSYRGAGADSCESHVSCGFAAHANNMLQSNSCFELFQ